MHKQKWAIEPQEATIPPTLHIVSQENKDRLIAIIPGSEKEHKETARLIQLAPELYDTCVTTQKELTHLWAHLTPKNIAQMLANLSIVREGLTSVIGALTFACERVSVLADPKLEEPNCENDAGPTEAV